MADKLYVNTGDVSSALLRSCRSHVEDAVSKLGGMERVGAMTAIRIDMPLGGVSLFTAEIASEVAAAAKILADAEEKLARYGEILDSGTEEMIQIDGRYKDNLTNAWERGSYAAKTWAASTLGYWKDNYENKGWSYKTVQSGKMMGETALSLIGCAAAWTKAFFVPGSLPGAVLSTIYLGNDVQNMNSDLVNLWRGNFDEVGKANKLKDKARTTGGNIGDMLGNREAGEAIGEMIYHGGELADFIVNLGNIDAFDMLSDPKSIYKYGNKAEDLYSQIRQSDFSIADLKEAVGEIPDYAKGVTDVIFNCPLSEVKKDLKLLEYAAPKLNELRETVDLLKSVQKTTGSLMEKGIDVLMPILRR